MFIGCRLFFVLAEGPAGDLDLRVGQPSAVAFLEGPAGDLDLRGGDQSLLANGVWSMDCAFCASEGGFGLRRHY